MSTFLTPLTPGQIARIIYAAQRELSAEKGNGRPPEWDELSYDLNFVRWF